MKTNSERKRTTRVCYNCKHWHKKEYNHCQHSGPWGGDIAGDPNCTFETKWPNAPHLHLLPCPFTRTRWASGAEAVKSWNRRPKIISAMALSEDGITMLTDSGKVGEPKFGPDLAVPSPTQI